MPPPQRATRTGVEAGVVVLGVAVIAGFILGERPVLDVGSQRAVGADRHLAGIGAAIGRVGVAVIALFGADDQPVAAHGGVGGTTTC